MVWSSIGFAESRVRVRYAETDQMGVVYHANYLVWLEIGRVDLIRQLGLDYKSMERDEGCGIAVVEANVRYKAPARYDDEIVIRTRLAQVRGSLLRFAYTVHRSANADGPEHLLAEAQTVHIVVNGQMQRAAMPGRYAEAFRRAGLVAAG
jgi:acyl-CoA thioester hydrolase